MSERRKFGYHLGGMTPYVYIRRKQISPIANISTRDIEDVAIYEGNINGDTYSNFIDQIQFRLTSRSCSHPGNFFHKFIK